MTAQIFELAAYRTGQCALEADPLDSTFRAYCRMRNELDRMRGIPYALYETLLSDWTRILRAGESEQELTRLRKARGRE